VGDLKKSLRLPPEIYNLYPTPDELHAWKATRFAFDLEWDAVGNITLCGLSDCFYHAVVVPWHEPYISILKDIFERAETLIGHNIINADLPYFERLHWNITAEIEDTMLKQHLVQPDFPHDLGFVASVFTNKVFWKGKGWEEEDEDGNIIPGGQQWKTWDKLGAIPREFGGYGGCRDGGEAFRLYNARDTDGEFQINTPLTQLLDKYNMRGVYENVSRPIAYICRDISQRGLRIDNSRLGEVRKVIDEQILIYEEQLPEELKPYEQEVGCHYPAPEGTYKTKIKYCKGTKKNPHLSEHPFFYPTQQSECNLCGKQVVPGKMSLAKIIRGTKLERVIPYNSAKLIQEYATQVKAKEVYNSKTGNTTTGKRARKIWAKDHPEFILLNKLREQFTQRTNFAKDSLLSEKRMFFNLKVHGTSEGRLSSSGRRKGIDLNIQNQPDEFRIIYIPDFEGWGFLNLDIIQGENMLTTWLAKDWARWERINSEGYDEHCDLASRIFGRTITKSKLDKPFRDIGKKINHGRNYGMGVKKQLDSLMEEGFDQFTQTDVKEFIEIWKSMNPRTAEWQFETIEIAQRQGYLCNPFGRKRWFSSRDLATKALAFLPASTLADMVLRMMIAHYPSHPRIGPAIQNLQLETYMDIIPEWIMSIQVHDSIVLQGPHKTHLEQAERSKMIMEQKWKELDNFRFKVDIKYSTKSWGECEVIRI